MSDLIVRSLKEDEKRRLFEFARNLPEWGLWGKKGRLLRGDFGRFQKFFEYIKPFDPQCFLVAEEESRFVGFVVAVYNPEWINELADRYGHDVDKRAYILGLAFSNGRKDVLFTLIDVLTDFLSRKGMRSVEYPTLGNVCLTTGTDVLTAGNVDALLVFREAGFKISECYHSMKLNLDSYTHDNAYPTEEETFRSKERAIEIVKGNATIGKISWDPVENGKTSIDVHVERAHRGKGLGTALLAKVLNQLKTEGAKVVELGVDGNNLSALKLYRKVGFEVFATHFYIIKPCQRDIGSKKEHGSVRR